MSYHIEIYENPLKFPESKFERYFAMLPTERRNKVLSYRSVIDRNLSLLSYVLLLQGLEKYYGVASLKELRLAYNKYGKPYLIDYPDLHFNISHCHEVVVCAFANRPIGVDVEGLITYDETLLQKVANIEEYHAITNSKDPRLAFTMLWTKKESYMKMRGIGLVDDIHSIFEVGIETNVRFEHHYKDGQLYVLSVCYLMLEKC